MVSFFTFCARIWLFTSMDSFMWMFMLGLAETFSTMGATEGLLSCMSSLMYLQESFMRKCFLHSLHSNGLSPVCFSALWCLRVFGLEKDLGQLVQGKVCLSSECNLRCCFSFPDWEHLNWHIVHKNDFSFVWTRRCGWSDDAWTKDFSQTVHSNDLICACVFWWDFSWAESTNFSSREEQSKSFFTGVPVLMTFKGIQMSEGLSTFETMVSTFPCVCLHMRF